MRPACWSPIVALLAVLSLAATSLALAPLIEDGVVGDHEARPGEPIVVEAKDDLIITGDISTHAPAAPGSQGPSIRIETTGTLWLGQGASLVAADGTDGHDAEGLGTVEASKGGDGGSIHLAASRIVSHGARLAAGDGGHGGTALAGGIPDALARGGQGGAGGSIAIDGPLEGPLERRPGDGGSGGHAEASGQDACDGSEGSHDTSDQNGTVLPTGDGADAQAAGGEGGCGAVDERAGTGGTARAYGGDGGPSEQGVGGAGGDANATGGTGGPGADACFPSQREAAEAGIEHAGHGGHGGSVEAEAGDGGPGTTGGAGGAARTHTAGGPGGNFTPPIARGGGGSAPAPDGFIRATGGDGGPGIVGGPGGAAGQTLEGGPAGRGCQMDTVAEAGYDVLVVGVAIVVAALAVGREG